jgi:predicted metalloprotease with PDZ domain
MKKLLLIPGILFFLCFSLFAGNEPAYRYYVDLDKVENDRLQVELIAPPIKSGSVAFYMPKIVPGTYTVYDFGRFVSDLKAFDQQGNAMQVERKDVNTWIIKDARRLHRLTYLVDDSDDDPGANQVFGMAGTNFEAGENITINTFGFFGYFDGMEFLPFEVTIDHPEEFYGSTALRDLDDASTRDLFRADDYHHLADSPMMYCRPDTVTIQVANAEVLVSVHSPKPDMNAKLLADAFEPLLLATRDFLGGRLPVDRYAFILYFRDPAKGITNGTGALEHSHSSFYYLPYFNPQAALPILKDIAAHEFFHILTPLNIHSKEIHYFDFNNPKMSRHLWLYEGVTEYFAGQVQAGAGLITFEHYLKKLEGKLADSQNNYQDELAFTKMSRKVLDKYPEQFGNVYQKGALIGMALDIELRRLSGGKYGLIDLMQDLSKKYGKDEPFRDKKLFDEIAALTFPEIKNFFKTYVGGDKPLPYEEIFRHIGVSYTPPQEVMEFTLGNVSLDFDQESSRLRVVDVSQTNAFGKALGYQAGDVILALNGQKVPSSGIQKFFNEAKAGMQEGQPFQVAVLRNDGNGGHKEIILSAPAQKTPKMTPPSLKALENPTGEQLKLRRAWLGERA